MSDWIDIGSAPKDGTVIDLWCVRYELPDPSRPDVRKVGKRFIECRWIDPSRTSSGIGMSGLGAMQDNPAKWEGTGLSKEWRPTHWMKVSPPVDHT